MKTLLALAALALLAACSQLPSMQYCEQVQYTRTGNQITLHAECRAPVGGSLPGL